MLWRLPAGVASCNPRCGWLGERVLADSAAAGSGQGSRRSQWRWSGGAAVGMCSCVALPLWGSQGVAPAASAAARTLTIMEDARAYYARSPGYLAPAVAA